jgi:hypothetical protein
MPIKWSAVKVSQAMDEVEKQVFLADQFIAEAKAKAEAARKIPNLPQYIDQRLLHLIGDIERMSNVKSSIEAVRKDIPDGAIEAELEAGKHGKTQTMM